MLHRKEIQMETSIIILFSISIILFILSFSKKDQTKELEKQIDTFSMNFMQELYQLKKKIRILEEELLTSSDEKYYLHKASSKSNDLLTEVMEYYHSGYPIAKIAKLTTLSENEVYNLISNSERK